MAREVSCKIWETPKIFPILHSAPYNHSSKCSWNKSQNMKKILKYMSYSTIRKLLLSITVTKIKFSTNDFFDECEQIRTVLRCLYPFVPNEPFLYPWKNQGRKEGCTGNEWVNAKLQFLCSASLKTFLKTLTLHNDFYVSMLASCIIFYRAFVHTTFCQSYVV